MGRHAAKAEWKADHGFSLTYLPFISRAVIDGLDEFPHLNASVGDRDLIVHDYIDLDTSRDLAWLCKPWLLRAASLAEAFPWRTSTAALLQDGGHGCRTTRFADTWNALGYGIGRRSWTLLQ